MTTFDLKLHMAYKMAAGKRFPFPVPAWFAVWTVAVSLTATVCVGQLVLYLVFFDETKLAGLVLVEQMPHFGRYFLARLAPAHAKIKLNSISSRILRFYTCFVKQKITQTHFNLLCLFFQRPFRILRTDFIV